MIIVTANVYPKLQSVKIMVRPLSNSCEISMRALLLRFSIFIRLWKSWLDHSLKSAVSEHALTPNMWKRPKLLQNLPESNFIMFYHHSQGIWFGKYLP